MNSKIVSIFLFFYIVQGISSKAIGPVASPAPATNPALIPLISELQMRLNQLSSVTKSTIGMTVGQASKNVGFTTSTAKNNVKLLVNSVEKNPNISKDCLSVNKATIQQLNSQTKTQLSFCSKNSQIQLKSMNQVQKEISQQTTTLYNKIFLGVNECTLANPGPNDTAALTECFTEKSSTIQNEITDLEDEVLQTVTAVQTGVNQVVDLTNSCNQQVQNQLKLQTDALALQLEQCTIANPVTADV